MSYKNQNISTIVITIHILYSRFTYNRTVLLVVLFSLPSPSMPFVAWHAYFPAAAVFTDCKTKLPNWLYCITRPASLLFFFSPFLSPSSVRLFSVSCVRRTPYVAIKGSETHRVSTRVCFIYIYNVYN